MSVLSDRDIRTALEAGGIAIRPYDPADLQPSSVDLHLDRSFRVFRNNRYPFIDVRAPQPDLTELLTVTDDEPFVLHPGEFVLGQTLEWVELPNDLVARLEGKALALDTPVPTPGGWRTMADLEPGDTVFDETGAPTLVVAATEAMLGRPCREVTFSDGTRIVADAEHQWVTIDETGRRHGRSRVEVRTTDAIARSIRSNGALNHHVPVAGPVQYPTRLDLPIEPYTLGAWLGDGTTTAAAIPSVDDEILEQISGDGYPVRRLAYTPHLYSIGAAGRTRDPDSGRFARNGTLSSQLRNLGMREGKSVPRPYLEAGIEQRLALLQGLMDADGFVDDVSGRCEFTSINEGLADAVVELASSLGFRPFKTEGRATLNGTHEGATYRVKFTPDRPVFRLPRKLARQKPADVRYHRFRAIDVIREVASVPVRCIQVASPRGVFLASRSFIPTHNSSLGRLGLLIHSTAGYVDPGWKGNLTLELSNVANLPIALYFGMKIGQISFFEMSSPVERPYGSASLGSKYQGQSEPTASAFHRDFTGPRIVPDEPGPDAPAPDEPGPETEPRD
ncbi:MAG TPA: dCTP deaminase [Patescibacteria group bacterium]|nr:dCTP deaminase [Patescibacteria group bacterium]